MKKVMPVNMVNIKGEKGTTWTEIPLRYSDIINGEVLEKKLKEFIPIDSTFTTHIRIRHSNNEIKTAGPQFGGIYRSEDDIKAVKEISKQRISDTQLRYLIENDDIDYLIARVCLTAPSFIEEFGLLEGFNDTIKEDEEKSLNGEIDEELGYEDYKPIKSQIFEKQFNYCINKSKELIETIGEKNMIDISKARSALKIPVSSNYAVQPKKLKTESKDGYITKIMLAINNEEREFLSIIKEKENLLPNKPGRVVYLTDDFDFYLVVNKQGIPYVLAIQTDKDGIQNKIKYSLYGVIMSQVKDTPIKSDSEENNAKIIKRSYNNSKFDMYLDIYNSKVRFLRTQLKLHPIKARKSLVPFVNSNLGCIDLETYQEKDGSWKVYACGFKTTLSNENVIYYIDKSKNSDDIIINMIDELLRSKYSYVSFYCHNLGGYDIVFILNVLYKFNERSNINVYEIKLAYKDDKILSISIWKKITDNKKLKIIIKDSYTILPDSLDNLSRSFELSENKLKFPYAFVKWDTLNYIGVTPNIKYYNNTTDKEYKEKLYKEYWSLKEETIEYLKNDLNCLLEILRKASKQIFRDYAIDMTSKLTISGLAMQLFISDYYPKEVIPIINEKKTYLDLQKAYFGGITEVYKPHGYNLYYYDVNSLYPSVALNDMPGLTCYKQDFYSNPDIQNVNFFGFFYCNVKTPNNDYFGVLPYRDKKGVHYRLGEWSGWYFSEELKFAQSLGYEINVKKGYMFSRQEKVFEKYINDIYKIKSTSNNKTQRTIAKSMLNNLLGRFGINIDKPITKILDVNDFNEYCTMYKIDSFKEITKEKYLVTYYPYFDKQIIKEHGLDIVKLISKYGDKEPMRNSNSSIVISSAVNAYARIHMSKLKLDIMAKGGIIYYSDTDSIVTNIELEDSHPTDLGKLKLEYKIKEGIFISGKTYCLVTHNDDIIIKAKGFNSNSLTYNDFISLLNTENVMATKTISVKSWDKAYVSIKTIYAIINALGSDKRIKIFENNKWVDTKPVFMNKLD